MKKIFLFVAFALVIAGCSKENLDLDGWDGSVIPVYLDNIEAVNIDNSGELPVVSASPIKKEAYMVGVRWITDNSPTEDDNIFITGPIQRREQIYSSLGSKYQKAIKCNTQFNAGIPADSYVSKFFKEIDKSYLPPDIDEGFVLLVAPDTGEHSFRVEYYEGNNLVFFHDTPLINFF